MAVSGYSAVADGPNDPAHSGAADVPGLDGAAIKSIREHFVRVNRERLHRVRDALSAKQKDFLDLLPLLFHTNYPLLPGFVGQTTPFGVSEYNPDRAALSAARRVTRSFEFRPRAARTVDVHSLYMMGSSGTVAYSRTSDFDMWLVHRPDLDEGGRRELQAKCTAISAWADSIGLEVHFFALSDAAVREGRVEGLSSESSGSAQRYLLLDEFYRTALLLAGRYPVWWLVPPDLESGYEDVVRTIRRKRFVHPREFVDFGTVGALPAAEFVGAALWQLTKAIASPHKSALKIILLEAYAHDYPETDLLSMRYKRSVYAGERSLNALDPYIVFQQRIEDYLHRLGDAERLELARRAWYFKVNVQLTRRAAAGDEWRHELVRETVTAWGWDDPKIATLDARAGWKIDQVLEERSALVSALTHTYRFISRFGRDHAEQAAVTERDMTILGRKLFAAFEHKAGKIEIVSRGLGDDLAEAQLLIAESRSDSEQGGAWGLFRGTAVDHQRPLRRAQTLIELLVWCYFNGVLARWTRVNVQNAEAAVSARDIDSLGLHLRQHFPPGSLRIPDVDELARPPELVAASTFVNLGEDPLSSYTRQGKSLTSSHVDALSYGGLHENLVHDIDYLVVSSWGEVLTFKFQGVQGLLECIGEHLRWIGRERRSVSVPCNCFTAGYAHAITRRVSRLFTETGSWFQRDPEVEHKLYIVKGEDQFYALRAEGSRVSVDYIGPQGELLRYLGKPRDQYTAVTLDALALVNSPLEVVYADQHPNEIHCYYLASGSEVQLFVIDEHGALFHERTPFHTEAALVHHLREFFESIQLRQNSAALTEERVGMPASVHFHRITRTPDQSLRQRAVDLSTLGPAKLGFNVQVIGEAVGGQTRFTLYCGGREFSTLDYGEQVFEAIAEHIVRKRRGAARYPIHISDIDLSRLALEEAGQRLQTIHYLRYKRRIEERLNEVLLAG